MQISFQDFYGQFVNINNETASGNIRMRVRTCENLHDVATTKEEDCELETDISLNQSQLKILIGALECMADQD